MGPNTVDTDADFKPKLQRFIPIQKEDYDGDKVLPSMQPATETTAHWSPHNGNPYVNCRLVERCAAILETMSTSQQDQVVRRK